MFICLQNSTIFFLFTLQSYYLYGLIVTWPLNWVFWSQKPPGWLISTTGKESPHVAVCYCLTIFVCLFVLMNALKIYVEQLYTCLIYWMYYGLCKDTKTGAGKNETEKGWLIKQAVFWVISGPKADLEIWSRMCSKPRKYYFEIKFVLSFIAVTFCDKQVQQWQGTGWRHHNRYQCIKKLTNIFRRI